MVTVDTLPLMGRYVDPATPCTPGIARTLSRSAEKNAGAAGGRDPCSLTTAVSLSAVVNPGLDGRSVRNVRIIRTAPTRRISDSAICPATSEARIHARDAVVVPV